MHRSLPVLAVVTLALLCGAIPSARADFTFTRIADTSLAAPGGGAFSNFSIYPRFDSAGNVYFQANTSGGPAQGLYRYENGSLSRLLGVGDAAPSGGTITAIDLPNVRGNTIAFRASTQATGLSQPDIYAIDNNGIRRVASYNGRIPGSDFGRFSGFSIPTIAGDGRIAFNGQSLNEKSGFYVTGPGGLTRILSDGDAAPGGGTFFFGGSPVIPYQNAAGNILFSTSVSNGPSNAVYLDENGTLTRIVARDDPAPGGGTFVGTVAVALTDDNRSFFWGTALTSGPVRTGIFAGDGSGRLTQLVATGNAAPGGGTFSVIQPPFVTASGDYSFLAVASGKQAVYKGSSGSLSLVTAVGNALFGSTITALAIQVGFGSVDSRPSLDPNGDISFYYELADGRKGLALAKPAAATAPEPGTLALLLMAVLLASPLFRRRWRRALSSRL